MSTRAYASTTPPVGPQAAACLSVEVTLQQKGEEVPFVDLLPQPEKVSVVCVVSS